VASVAGIRELLLEDEVGLARAWVVEGLIVELVFTRVRSGDSSGGMAEENIPLKRCEFASAEYSGRAVKYV
jgi:hypothetical protein